MELYERLEQILRELRPAFKREATYEWFVLLIWGVILTTQDPAVTSYVNALGLSEAYYGQALHWFSSRGFKIQKLCGVWGEWLREQPNRHELKGQLVYVGDGVKVGKEGRRMPGVKKLHQESGDTSKPEWIRGHYFSALSQLLGSGEALFATPIILKLHDGIEGAASKEEGSLVDKMAAMCVEYVRVGSYVILDAYYSCGNVLKPFRDKGIHLVSRVRITTVGYTEFCRNPRFKGPGRPREWGDEVKLRTLFAPIDDFLQASVWLYGQRVIVHYQCFQFYWDSTDELVLFVLTQLPNGKQLILLSSDLNLTGQQVIEAYGWRFKIEVTFRTLIQILGGFSYRFWLKSMEKSSKWPKNMPLVDYPQAFHAQVNRKVEAFERFINLNAIVLGLLQVLALEMPKTVWNHFPLWFRTVPKHGYPTEQIVKLSIQRNLHFNLLKSTPSLLLTKLLDRKTTLPQHPSLTDLAA
jgi:hypothetical protein